MKEGFNKIFSRGFYNLLCIIMTCVVIYLLAVGNVLFGWKLPDKLYMLLLLPIVHGLLIFRKYGVRRFAYVTAGTAAFSLLLTLGLYVGWICFSQNGIYEDVDNGKAELYAGRRVMLIVPHQDDEINVLGGVMEEYVEYGSEVYVVFVTNGDYYGIPAARYMEAIDAMEGIGIEEDHVIFLGYGDQWAGDGPHIYNAEPEMVMTSRNGVTQTYGMDFHAAYREGRDYTVENFRADMQSVILEYKPDVIFCSDYDAHIDHRATTLMFDKVMGDILRENSDYYPVVYKGFAYDTAWYAPEDYYQENMLSTVEIDLSGRIYRWEDRVRLPVDAGTMSRSLVSGSGYQSLAEHKSQRAFNQAQRVVNGDRVFWRRYTDSLCTNAKIQTSSGNAALLNDFMFLENHDLLDVNRRPYDGIWIPEAEDQKKSVEITLAETSDIHSIVLYDHPSNDQNVTGAEICFADGSVVGPVCLEPGGASTTVLVEKENVSSFEIRIVSAEGETPGLTEIEAFAETHTADAKMIKLMDARGNFVYDYWLDRSGTQAFSLYRYGLPGAFDARNYDITVSNDKCETVWENGELVVICPEGEECLLTVSCQVEGVSDSVMIRNPGGFARAINDYFQQVEDRVLEIYLDLSYTKWLEEPVVVWLLEKVQMLKYCVVEYLC